MQATVNIPLSEFQEIQKARTDAENEVIRLKAQIQSSEIKSSDQTLLSVAKAGIEITRFAVANLPAESTKAWPTKELQTIAELLPSMPGSTTDDQELAVTLNSFSRECEFFESRRRI